MSTVLDPDGEKRYALLVSSDEAAKGNDEPEVPTVRTPFRNLIDYVSCIS
jgi:hypothetical protein